MGLTPLQARLVEYLGKCAMAPSTYELARATGSSQSGVRGALLSLAGKGLVDHTPGAARSWSLVDRRDLSAVPTPALIAELARRQ